MTRVTCLMAASFVGAILLTSCGGNPASLDSTSKASVNSQPTLQAITLTPIRATVPPGGTTSFIAIGQYSDGTGSSVTNSVSWSTSDQGVAAVTGSGFVSGKSPGIASIIASSGSISGSATLTVTPLPTEIQIFPAHASVGVGRTIQFSALAIFADATIMNMTAFASWSSANPLVAASIGVGDVQANTVGTAAIEASVGSVTGSANLSVTPSPVVTSLFLLPQNPTFEMGTQFSMVVFGVFSDGSVQPLDDATLTSSNTAVIAPPLPGHIGMGIVGVGTTTITAQFTPSPGVKPFTASTTATVIPTQPLFALVVSSSNNTVSQYGVGESGQLNFQGDFAVGGAPVAIAVDQVHRFVYIADSSSGQVSAFSIQTNTGGLVPVPGSPFTVGGSPDSLTVEPSSSRWLYVTNNTHDLFAFAIDPITGSLSPVLGSPYSVGNAAQYTMFGPSPETVYVANADTNNVSGFSVDFLTGHLTPLPFSPYVAGSGPAFLTSYWIGTNSQWAGYILNSVSDDISLYYADGVTGIWAPTGIRVPTGKTPSAAVSFQPYGGVKIFMYVANLGSGSISGYEIDPPTGTLLPVASSPFAAGTGPAALAVDPSRQFLYVADSGCTDSVLCTGNAGEIAILQVDPTTGLLTRVGEVSGIAAPASIALSKAN